MQYIQTTLLHKLMKTDGKTGNLYCFIWFCFPLVIIFEKFLSSEKNTFSHNSPF